MDYVDFVVGEVCDSGYVGVELVVWYVSIVEVVCGVVDGLY